MKRTLRGCWAFLMVVLCALPLERGVAQGTFEVPSDRANQMGHSSTDNPFLQGADSTVVPWRYQEVFGSDDIPLPLSQYYITGVNFRLATLVGPPGHRTSTSLDAVLPAIELRMSTTATRSGVDMLANEYDRNAGPDMTVVVPRGPLHLTGTFDPNASVQAFSVHISFSQPYLYNRTGKDLLLDIINYGGSPVVAGFDAMGNGFGDPVSVVAGRSLTAGTVSTVGLVAQFEYSPIPEPNTLSLISMGFALGLCGGLCQATRRHSICP